MIDGKQLLGLGGFIGLSFLAAAAGGIASAGAGPFYQELARPGWAPPAALFGPVWSVLYLLIGISGWLVWRAGGFRASRAALVLYLGQLAVNSLWTWLFFAWRQGALAFVGIVILLLLIVATILAFRRVTLVATALLLPYLAWVSFATALTWAVWRRNPTLLA